MKKIKKIIRPIFNVIKNFWGEMYALVKQLQYIIMVRVSRVILIDTPIHRNLGDHAIVLAEKQLIKKILGKKKSYELTADTISDLETWFASKTPQNKVILVHGGGFLGCLWKEEEYRFRRILKAFNNQKIVVFPQTITFDVETDEGIKFMEESRAIYSAHPNLTIFVRETQSEKFMRQYFPTVRVVLVPDIVTNLDVSIDRAERNDILLCMRADLEKRLTEDDLKLVLNILHDKYPTEKICFTDTVLKKRFNIRYREREVNKKLEQFAKAKLVITDRLHGMIFAAIVGTPCVAFGNSNGKVKGVYEWIKNIEYVEYIEDISTFEKKVDKVLSVQHPNYDKDGLREMFNPLEDILKALVGNAN